MPHFRQLPAERERRAQGLSLRETVPLEAHADLSLPRTRGPALEVLQKQDKTRLGPLVPIRYGRMLASPFTYFRGGAAIMARDLAYTPRTEILVQLCGDAHIANFGLFASPERALLFDVNDFDETLRGAFEWDLKRLAASCALAAEQNGLTGRRRRAVTTEAVLAYCQHMDQIAKTSPLEFWYSRIDISTLEAQEKRDRKVDKEVRQQANLKTNVGALNKLTEDAGDGRRRIKTKWPVITRFDAQQMEEMHGVVNTLLDEYLETLPSNRKTLLGKYHVVDVAMKVVGVGSVGTRCWIVLLQSGDGHPLFLQVKEAEDSVLEPYFGHDEYSQDGERVVRGQEEIQAASDVFLGWCRNRTPKDSGIDHALGWEHDREYIDYYVRQLWDGKSSPPLTRVGEQYLTGFAKMCGMALARAHGRSGDPAVIAGYVGDGKTLATGLASYAESYMSLVKLDYNELVAAVDRGLVDATPDI